MRSPFHPPPIPAPKPQGTPPPPSKTSQLTKKKQKNKETQSIEKKTILKQNSTGEKSFITSRSVRSPCPGSVFRAVPVAVCADATICSDEQCAYVQSQTTISGHSHTPVDLDLAQSIVTHGEDTLLPLPHQQSVTGRVANARRYSRQPNQN